MWDELGGGGYLCTDEEEAGAPLMISRILHEATWAVVSPQDERKPLNDMEHYNIAFEGQERVRDLVSCGPPPRSNQWPR